MTGSLVGRLKVALGLDGAGFSRGLNSQQAAMKKFAGIMAKIAAGVAAGIGLISAAALRGAAGIDVAAKAARRLASSIGGFFALKLGAGEAGVAIETLIDGIQTMDRELAKGSKNAISALGQLGLAAADFDGLEADQKLALLSDRVAEFGLSTGEATALLQDLGIRNREMVLAVLAGGDVFRNARRDIEDYGLAVSQIDSASIEQANDRIGRLGLIGQYAGQQLAIALVPAMGRLALAMTDSLREGGLLRSLIDAFVGNIQRLATYVAVASVGLGTVFVGALVASAVAAASLSGALILLRAAIIRTGIGVLVIGAGELVYQFTRLVSGAGGFGNALDLLKDVAIEVWGRIGSGVGALVAGMVAAWEGMKAQFFFALHDMLAGFAKFVENIASGLNSVFGINLDVSPLFGVLSDLNEAGSDAFTSMQASGKAASSAWAAVKAPLASVQALRDAVTSTNEAVSETVAPVNELGDALDSAAGKGGGAVDKLKDKTDTLAKSANGVKTSFQSAFTGLVTSAKSVSEAISGLLSKFAEMLANSAFDALWGSLSGALSGGASGGVFGSLGGLLGFAGGTNYAPAGLAMINERGGELVNLPSGAQVIPHDLSKRMVDRSTSGGGGTVFSISIDAKGAQVGVAEQIDAKLRAAMPSFVNQAISVGAARRNRGYAV